MRLLEPNKRALMEGILHMKDAGLQNPQDLEIIGHPAAVRELLEKIVPQASEVPDPDLTRIAILSGVPVRMSDHVPEWHVDWVFPEERFVVYEANDEEWCRFFGIGKERRRRMLYLIDRRAFRFDGSAFLTGLAWLNHAFARAHGSVSAFSRAARRFIDP